MSAKLPLVYSCSGCSSAAQMANHLAVRLDRDGAAEMSCIAGVGGGVAGLVRTAQSGRSILALDGCVLRCVSACLANAGVVADTHLLLSEHGVKKRQHADFDPIQAAELYVREVLPAAQALHRNAAARRVVALVGSELSEGAALEGVVPDAAAPGGAALHGAVRAAATHGDNADKEQAVDAAR